MTGRLTLLPPELQARLRSEVAVTSPAHCVEELVMTQRSDNFFFVSALGVGRYTIPSTPKPLKLRFGLICLASKFKLPTMVVALPKQTFNTLERGMMND